MNGWPDNLFSSLTLRPLLFSLLAFSCPRLEGGASGKNDQDSLLRLYATHLGGRLNVLSISVRPGEEDSRTLAYLRFARGATITSVYVSNGEAGESDIGSEYPSTLAAIRREEAVSAMVVLGGSARFLNFPDLISAADSSKVRSRWPADSLQNSLLRSVLDSKPDLILLSRDHAFDDQSTLAGILRRDLLAAVRLARVKALRPWSVERVAYEAADQNGVRIRRVPAQLGSLIESMAESVAASYRSLSIQRTLWKVPGGTSYHVLLPQHFQPRILDADLPRAVPARLGSLHRQIQRIGATISTLPTNPGRKRAILTGSLAGILDTLDRVLLRPSEDTRERKLLLDWKESLEGMRNVLRGFGVEYTLSDSLLTDRQLTYLTITKSDGFDQKGTTELFFPGVESGWIVNESMQKRMPLVLNEPYRLVSPTNLEYDYPRATYGLLRSQLHSPTHFFVIHKPDEKTRAFVERKRLFFSFAPKLSAEVLTPIVLATPGEGVVVRIMNHARDGLRDSLSIRDSIARTAGHPFRLTGKGVAFVDTLRPVWNSDLTEGSYVSDVKIGDVPLVRFVVRRSDIKADTTRRVGVIAGLKSATMDALRRLKIAARSIAPDAVTLTALSENDVVIVDRRGFTLHPHLLSVRSMLVAFAEQGGHLVVLAQDPKSWEASSIVKNLQLSSSSRLDEMTEVRLDSAHSLMQKPNGLSETDFSEWISLRAHNTVAMNPSEKAEIPLRVASTGQPLIVSAATGKGRITYIDLALAPQWMNVHPGALKLLANVVAWK